MTRKELTDRIYDDFYREGEIKSYASAERIVETIFEIMSDGIVSDGECKIKDFGTFYVADRKKTETINPYSNERVKLKATKVIRFRPGKTLKGLLKGTK